MEQPIKIKIIRDQVEQTEETEKTEKIEVEASPSILSMASRTIWERISKVCLCLLAGLTPLFFLPLTIAPVEINKQFLVTVLVLIAFLRYLIHSLKSRVIVYPKSWLSLAVLILLIVAGVSTIFSQARWVSIFGNLIQNDALLSFLIYGLVFFLAAVFIKKDDLPKIGLCFLAGFILTLVFGWLQIFGKFILPWAFTRQTSFNSIGSVFSWGVFITFGLVMIITALTSLKLAKVFKIILPLVGLLIILTLIILNFQLLWIGLALAMFLLAVYKFTARSNISLPLVIIVISLFFILVNRQLPAFITVPAEVRPNLATTLTITKGVFTGRQILLGSGPATFSYNFSRFRPVELNQTAFWSIRFNQGFSFLATLLVTLGLLGILAVLFLIFSFIRQGLRVWKDEKFLIVFSGIFFLMINLFFYPASFVQLLFIFLGLGLLVIDSGTSFEMEFYSPSKLQNFRSFIVFLGIILLLSFSLFSLYLSSQKYTAAVYYEKGLQSPSLVQSLIRIDKAVRLDPQSDQYLRALSQARLLQANELARTPSTQEKLQDIQNQFQNIIASAINAARRATELNSVDSLNWSNLANVYENIMTLVGGADILAQQNYKKAMELDPKNPQAPVDLARTLIVSADQSQARNETELWEQKLNEAKNALEKSISLKSDYAPAHFLLAVTAMREGKTQEAIARLELTRGMVPFDAGFAFQLGLVYYQNNQLEKAQSEFERAVGLDANYSNARYFLGLIYDRFGNRQAALEQFEKIGVLNPGNEEIKRILDNLRNGKSALTEIVPPAQPPAERLETPVSEEKKELNKP